MSRAIFNGGTTLLPLGLGTTVLAIDSSAQVTGVTFGANTFRIADLEDYTLCVDLLGIGFGKNQPFTLQLFNSTTGAVEQEADLEAPNNGRLNEIQNFFNFTVVNAAHDYQLRIVISGDSTGARAMELGVPNFRANLRDYTQPGAGDIGGSGTPNNLTKFTASQTVGDSRWTDDGATPMQPNADVNYTDQTLQRPVIRDYAMTASVVGVSGATPDLDLEVANTFDVTMDQNAAFTFSNPPASGSYGKIILALSGAFTPSWPAAVIWPGGSEPAYASPSLYAFVTFDGGTTWYGTQAGSAFA
jgi:hypothetical protein